MSEWQRILVALIGIPVAGLVLLVLQCLIFYPSYARRAKELESLQKQEAELSKRLAKLRGER